MRVVVLYFSLIFLSNICKASEISLVRDSIHIHTNNPIVEQILKNQVSRIEFLDLNGRNVIYSLEIIYKNNLPSKFIVNKSTTIDLYSKMSNLQALDETSLRKLVVNSLEELRSAFHYSKFININRSHSGQSIALQYSYKSLGLVFDAIAISITATAILLPLPAVGILAIKFIVQPLARYSNLFYQQAVDIHFLRSGARSYYSKPYSSYVADLYSFTERQLVLNTKKILSLSSSGVVFSARYCRSLFK